MKKVLLVAVLAVAGLTASAQTESKGKTRFRIGLEAGLPVGDAADAFGFAIGGTAKLALRHEAIRPQPEDQSRRLVHTRTVVAADTLVLRPSAVEGGRGNRSGNAATATARSLRAKAGC